MPPKKAAVRSQYHWDTDSSVENDDGITAARYRQARLADGFGRRSVPLHNELGGP